MPLALLELGSARKLSRLTSIWTERPRSMSHVDAPEKRISGGGAAGCKDLRQVQARTPQRSLNITDTATRRASRWPSSLWATSRYAAFVPSLSRRHPTQLPLRWLRALKLRPCARARRAAPRELPRTGHDVQKRSMPVCLLTSMCTCGHLAQRSPRCCVQRFCNVILATRAAQM